MPVHAGIQCFLSVLDHGGSCQGNNRNARIELPNGAGCVVAIHDGHLDIHQYKIEPAPTHGIDGLLAIVGNGDVKPHAAQERERDLLVDRVIFNEQNMTAQRFDGRLRCAAYSNGSTLHARKRLVRLILH